MVYIPQPLAQPNPTKRENCSGIAISLIRRQRRSGCRWLGKAFAEPSDHVAGYSFKHEVLKVPASSFPIAEKLGLTFAMLQTVRIQRIRWGRRRLIKPVGLTASACLPVLDDSEMRLWMLAQNHCQWSSPIRESLFVA